MEEADAMEDLVAAEAHRMTSNQYRNMKEVSHYLPYFSTHFHPQIGSMVGIWSHSASQLYYKILKGKGKFSSSFG